VSKDSISKTIKSKFTELLALHRLGVIVFTTYALLDAHTPTVEQRTASFKVSNDANTSLNGFYHWVSGTAYVKDSDLADGIIASGNNGAISGGTLFINNELNAAKNEKLRLDGFKIVTGKNIFNPESIISDSSLGGTGDVIDRNNFVVSNFIEVPASTAISINFINRVCQYDENFNFIAGTYVDYTPQTEVTITTDVACKYIRVSDYYTAVTSKMIEVAATSSQFEAYYIEEISETNTGAKLTFKSKEIINEAETINLDRGTNLFDHTKALLGNVDVVTGLFTEDILSEWWSHIELIAIKPNTQISVNNIYRLWEFDVDGDFIAGTYKTVTPQAEINFISHSRAAFMRIYDYKNTQVNKQIEYSATSTALVAYQGFVTCDSLDDGTPVEFNYKFEESTHITQWTGKKYLAIGDSITASMNYQFKVKAAIGAGTLQTHAKGGIGTSAMIDGDGAGGFPALSTVDLSDVDVITFFGGTNDRNKLVGVKTDMYPTQNTIFGLYNYAITSIYALAKAANNHNLRLIFIAPHKVGPYAYNDKDGGDEYPVGSGQTLEDIVNSCVTACGFYGVSVVDLYHHSNINNFTWDIFTSNAVGTAGPYPYPDLPDNVHPNDAGYTLIANMVANEINKFTPVAQGV
jgi:lysophospholipase L1-like esterase